MVNAHPVVAKCAVPSAYAAFSQRGSLWQVPGSKAAKLRLSPKLV